MKQSKDLVSQKEKSLTIIDSQTLFFLYDDTKRHIKTLNLKEVRVQIVYIPGFQNISTVYAIITYIDTASLTEDNIEEDEFGQKWIRLYRQKSSVQANSLLLEITQNAPWQVQEQRRWKNATHPYQPKGE